MMREFSRSIIFAFMSFLLKSVTENVKLILADNFASFLGSCLFTKWVRARPFNWW